MGLRGSSVVAQGAQRVDTDGAEGGDGRGCAADQQESEGAARNVSGSVALMPNNWPARRRLIAR
jgi:hypothetical protein